MDNGSSIDARATTALDALSRARDERTARALERGKGPRDASGGKDAEASKAFESFFATLFVRELRRALPQGFFDGAGSDVYTSWFDQHLGDALASRDALGIAGMVKAALGREHAAAADTEAARTPAPSPAPLPAPPPANGGRS